jgi:orotate phosphoribosyltransferase
MNEEEVLEVLEETGAIKKGHFRLSSGLHADTYYQCARALENPGVAQRMGEEIGRRFADSAVDIVVSPAIGGIVLGFSVALALGKPFIWAERKDGLMALRRGFCVEPGTRILIVEDVVTTGGSVAEVASLVAEAGATVAGIGCLMNRGDVETISGVAVKSLVRVGTPAFEESECPLCRAGKIIEIPGSRANKT